MKQVKRTFWRSPAVYAQLAGIMADLRRADVDVVDVIGRVVQLFAGHDRLILGFNSFLPDRYLLDIQADAVVVKVYAPMDGHDACDDDTHVTTGDGRRLTRPLGGTLQVLRVADLDSAGRRDTRDTLEYLQRVRAAYVDQPETYKRFMQLLHEYHTGRVREFETVKRVVGLFQAQSGLVLGFNSFLPAGYSVHVMGESSESGAAQCEGYIIEYPRGEKTDRIYFAIDGDRPRRKSSKRTVWRQRTNKDA